VTAAVIYTDLDGTLLDHFSYSSEAAAEMLSRLETLSIPVVPCTSKTKAELIPLRGRLRNTHPFIVENGAAVLIPRDYFPLTELPALSTGDFHTIAFVQPRAHWLSLLEDVGKPFRDDYRGFAELSTHELEQVTGLDRESAMQARQREYGEPVMWLGSPDQRTQFVAALSEAGATVLVGGRFLHVSGRCNKGVALCWLNGLFAANAADSTTPISIAAGDSGNDVAMLEAADHALIVRSPVHGPPTLTRKTATHISVATGPTGWAAGIAEILTELDLND